MVSLSFFLSSPARNKNPPHSPQDKRGPIFRPFKNNMGGNRRVCANATTQQLEAFLIRHNNRIRQPGRPPSLPHSATSTGVCEGGGGGGYLVVDVISPVPSSSSPSRIVERDAVARTALQSTHVIISALQEVIDESLYRAITKRHISCFPLPSYARSLHGGRPGSPSRVKGIHTHTCLAPDGLTSLRLSLSPPL